MGWLLALVLTAEPAMAQRPTWVEYTAPADCPTRADFQSELAARTELVRFVDTKDDASARVWVTVTRKGQGFEGRLVVEMDGARTRKTIGGSRCPTLKSALTLSTALLLDREHAKLVLPAPVVEAPPIVETPAPIAEVPPPAVVEVPVVVVVAQPQPEPAPAPVSAIRLSLRAGAWLSTGVSGLVDVGGGGRAEFSYAITSNARFIAALGAAGLSGRTVTADAGRVRYAPRFVGELDAGVGLVLGVLHAHVLGSVQLAPVFTEGLDGDVTLSSQRWLWAAGPAARVGIGVSGWEVSARVAGAFALRQERYVIDPRGVVFSVPAFAVTAALEVGRQF